MTLDQAVPRIWGHGAMNTEHPTVLVIEDDVAIGDLVGELLSDEGAIVVRAEDARSGLGLAYDSRPDLILLDHRLPDATGASVLHALRQADATRAILVITMSGVAPRLSPARARAAAH